jgi:proline iminopeptidase
VLPTLIPTSPFYLCSSLAYAQTHPERVSALILRGIFTLRRAELLFFYQEGSSYLWPEQFKPFLDHIPAEERDDMIAAYYQRLTSEDAQTRLEAARRWSTWENATSKLYLDEEHVKKGDDDKVS